VTFFGYSTLCGPRRISIGAVHEQPDGRFEIRNVGQVPHAAYAQRGRERVRVALNLERGHQRGQFLKLSDACIEQALCRQRADRHRHVLEGLLAARGRDDDLLDLLVLRILRTGAAGWHDECSEQYRSHSLPNRAVRVAA
jgi:hypothetical protein